MEWAVLLDGLWGFIASVTAVTAVLLSVRKLRRENTSQHDSNAELLRHVAAQVEDIGHHVASVVERLDDLEESLEDHFEDDNQRFGEILSRLRGMGMAVGDPHFVHRTGRTRP